MSETKKTATLTVDGTSHELPILSPTVGPDVVDVRRLYSDAGLFTYDPGYTSTAACDSTITYIDGEDRDAVVMFADAVRAHLARGGSALIATHIDLGLEAEVLDVAPFRARPHAPGADEESFF